MLLSLEHEMPVVQKGGARAGAAPEPAAFSQLWDTLSGRCWDRDGVHGILRTYANADASACKPQQTMTTDTGPTLEIAPSPSESIRCVEQQCDSIRSIASTALSAHNLAIIGSGVHPRVQPTPEDYYRLRTPRSAYDYAIRERKWHHWSIVHIAAMQEVIDVPFDRALAIFSVMNRLTGAMLFLFRNDPLYSDSRVGDPIYSVRPGAWRAQVPSTARFPTDRLKVGMPETEVATWGDYFHMLWGTPMFLLGTKSGDLVYVPDHPSFEQFLHQPPRGGWEARRIDGSISQRVTPGMVHVQQTDWTYMGFARLRLFWEGGADFSRLLEAHGNEAAFADFLKCSLKKVLIENRSSASPPPGFEMCSLALVAGIIENIDAVETLLRAKPYRFWLDLARAAETQVLDSRVDGVCIPELLETLVGLSSEGLRRRGLGEELYLDPLRETVLAHRASHAETCLAEWQDGGVDGLLAHLSYR